MLPGQLEFCEKPFFCVCDRRGALPGPHTMPMYPTAQRLGTHSLSPRLPRLSSAPSRPVRQRWSLAAARGGRLCHTFMSTASAPTAVVPSSTVAGATSGLMRASLGSCFPSRAPWTGEGGRGQPRRVGTRLTPSHRALLAGRRQWRAVVG